jgi:DNA-binding SARP family transcriptional activator
MFALNLLGGAALEGRGGPVTGRAAHRRRLALLAVLAAARGRMVARERILGLLWAEHDGSRARHLLSESLYVLRKELGEDAFLAAGDEVGLNGEVVASDVAGFEGAVEDGDLEGAARLYRGPFLDGFYVADAPEFERWAEAERDRLARVFTRALESLAGAREGEGRPQEAAEWGRRLAVHEPDN